MVEKGHTCCRRRMVNWMSAIHHVGVDVLALTVVRDITRSTDETLVDDQSLWVQSAIVRNGGHDASCVSS